MQICEHICGKLPVRRLDIHCWHLLSCCTRQSQHLLSCEPRIPWAVQLWCCVWDSKADRPIEKVSLISWYCFLLEYSTHTLALAFICHIVMVIRVVWFFCKSFSGELFVSLPEEVEFDMILKASCVALPLSELCWKTPNVKTDVVCLNVICGDRLLPIVHNEFVCNSNCKLCVLKQEAYA